MWRSEARYPLIPFYVLRCMICCVMQYSSSTPADDPLKLDECRRAGAAIKNLLHKDIKPRDIMTRPAFENAMVRTNPNESHTLLTKTPLLYASFCHVVYDVAGAGDGPGWVDQRRAPPAGHRTRRRRRAHPR